MTRDECGAGILLAAARELHARLEGGPAPLPAEARALVVVMREETTALLLRWATRRAVARRDATELDRLAAEVDALGEEIESLDLGSHAAARTLCRRLCRIELLAESCEPAFAGEHAGPLYPAVDSPAARPRSMTRVEVERFLAGRSWGVLCTNGPEGPYGVPVSFGFDGNAAFIATRDGRKAANLRGMEPVCLSVVEVAAPESWRSVVLRGRASELSGLGRMRGMSAIAMQRARTVGTAPGDLLRAAGATVYRIDPLELTGRLVG